MIINLLVNADDVLVQNPADTLPHGSVLAENVPPEEEVPPEDVPKEEALNVIVR